MRAYEFKVTGRVQGVGFRFFAYQIATSLLLTGEVWNARDGSVQGVVVGDKTDLFLSDLKNGPGRVDSVTHSLTAETDYKSFEIGPSR